MQSNFAEMGGRSEGDACRTISPLLFLSMLSDVVVISQGNTWGTIMQEFTLIQQKSDFIDFRQFYHLFFAIRSFYFSFWFCAFLFIYFIFSRLFSIHILHVDTASAICCSSCIFFCLLCSLSTRISSFFLLLLLSSLFPLPAYFGILHCDCRIAALMLTGKQHWPWAIPPFARLLRRFSSALISFSIHLSTNHRGFIHASYIHAISLVFFSQLALFLRISPLSLIHNSSFLVSWSIAFPHVASSIDMADFDFDRSVSVSLLSSSFQQQQHKNSVLPLSFCLTS